MEHGLSIRPFPAALGAEVACKRIPDLSTGEKREIHRAWLDHLVLVFRNQKLTDAELMLAASIFGKPETAAIKPVDGVYQDVAIISNVVENGRKIGVLGAGELLWHSDHSFHEKPLGAALLHAFEVPKEGGDTYFSNMYLALDMLPADLREKARGLTIKNDGSHNSAGERRTSDIITDVRSYDGPSHPIIRTHPETSINTLYLGRRPNAYINGLSVEDSEGLLNRLWSHATQPQFTLRHKWQVGDLVVWDNRSAMHRRDAFDPAARRVMHRAQCSGDRPVYRPEAAGRGRHSRGQAAVQQRLG